MHSPDTDLPKCGRRIFLRGGAVLTGAVVLGALPNIAAAASLDNKNQSPANYNQEVVYIGGHATTPYEAGTYHPNGSGTHAPMGKFGDFYEIVTGDSFVPHSKRFYDGVFSGENATNPGRGLCNGVGNREVCKLRPWTGRTIDLSQYEAYERRVNQLLQIQSDQVFGKDSILSQSFKDEFLSWDRSSSSLARGLSLSNSKLARLAENIQFTKEDVKALMAVFHYGDRWLTMTFNNPDGRKRIFDNDKDFVPNRGYEVGEPIYLHKMLAFWFRQGTGIVLDRSATRGEVWSNAIEWYEGTIKKNFGRRSEVNIVMFGASYPEPNRNNTDPYRRFHVIYEVDENNVLDTGKYTGGDTHVAKLWVPNPKISYPCYRIRNNIFPYDAIPLMGMIAGLTPEETVQVFGIYDQRRTDLEWAEYEAAVARGDCDR